MGMLQLASQSVGYCGNILAPTALLTADTQTAIYGSQEVLLLYNLGLGHLVGWTSSVLGL